MPNYFWEVPTGSVDGINTTFQLTKPYAPGSLGVYLNQVLGIRDSVTEGGWVETDPDTGVFDYLSPPLPGNVPLAFFADEPFTPPNAQDLEGQIQADLESDPLQGSIFATSALSGSLATQTIQATLGSSDTLSGVLQVVDSLQGKLKVCT